MATFQTTIFTEKRVRNSHELPFLQQKRAERKEQELSFSKHPIFLKMVEY